MSSIEEDRAFFSLLEYLKRTRNFNFSNYKRDSLERRLHRRMSAVQINNYMDYQDYLEIHPDEFVPLFNSILINVTAFFRDLPAWTFLQEKVIPTILINTPPGASIRVWSAGCASGEEACTLAMVLAEVLGKQAFEERVKIYATDIDEEALNQARHGAYDEKDLQTVPAGLREKYFERTNGQYAFDPDLRRSIIYGRHDLFQDAPISRLDLLACRNTLMYFNVDIQGQVLSHFHFALDNLGFLFLGKAELLLKHTALFTPLDMRSQVYSKVPNPALGERLQALNALAESNNVSPEIATEEYFHIQEAAFLASPQPQIVINSNGVLISFNNAAREIFGLTQKDLKKQFKDMDSLHHPVDLHPMIDQAFREKHVVVRSNMAYHLLSGEVRMMDVQVLPLHALDGSIAEINIVFTDMTRFQELKDDIQRYNHELETAYEELQTSNEELETTNEELQSTVVELETTNEELQSSNEEMETMNEELQSTNEELETVNDEMHLRTSELNKSNAFLQTILSSLSNGVAVVDRNLNVLIWNDQAENLWGLRSAEVANQSFLTLDIGLPIEALAAPFRSILDGKTNIEKRLLEAVNRRGKSFTCQVSCSPLLSSENKIIGVVIIMDKGENDSKGGGDEGKA